MGLDPEVAARLGKDLDLIINSSGLTDFNPDLRDALAVNVDSTYHLIEFIRASITPALCTSQLAMSRGSVTEGWRSMCVPTTRRRVWPDFDAETRMALPSRVDGIRRAAVRGAGGHGGASESGAAKGARGKRIERPRARESGSQEPSSLAEELPDREGKRRAKELGWPNTYTYTKSLAESLIAKYGAGLPIAIVRPAIVETSVAKPFRGWNEGINTSASLSYLLGTAFRQLPSNERKRLDIIPVDSVCAGMTLIGAALVERRHDPIYQLATSVTNPCDMGRSIELTSLGAPPPLPCPGRAWKTGCDCGWMPSRSRKSAIRGCRRPRRR